MMLSISPSVVTALRVNAVEWTAPSDSGATSSAGVAHYQRIAGSPW
jgi:hypothetical protein